MKLSKLSQFWSTHQPKKYLNQPLSTAIRFDAPEGIMPWPTSFWKKAALALPRLSSYPNPSANKLKQKLARLLNLDQVQLSLAAGSDEIIDNLTRLMLDPHDEVIVVNPIFFRFADASLRQGAIVNDIDTAAKNGFEVDQAIVQKVTTKAKTAKIIWLCSPNNPTGKTIRPSFLKDILESTSATVILDQTHEFPWSHNHLDLLQRSDRLILLRSFSKTCGLPGLRLGFAIGSKQLIQTLESWRLPFNLNALTHTIGQQVLQKENRKFVEATVFQIVKNTRQLAKKVSLLPGITCVPNPSTNLLLIKHRHKNLYQELLENDIVTTNLNHLESIKNQHFVRITTSTQAKSRLIFQKLSEICLR